MLPKKSIQGATPQHKRGDTFSFVAQLDKSVDLKGSQTKCQLRDTSGNFIDEVEVTVFDDNVIQLYKQDTTNWPLREARLDVQFTLTNGDRISTNTASINIVEDITL